MGIYIKDMRMPTNCESCPCKTSNAFGGLGCQATGYIPLRKANQDRPDNCPLISVPEHGRLIDADALIISTTVPLDGKSYRYVHIDNINNAPTVIPSDKSNMDSFIHILEEDDEENGMNSFIQILKD